MKIPLPALAASVLLAGGCALWVSVDYEPLILEAKHTRPVVEGPVFLFSGAPDRPHREIGIVEVRGRVPVDMLEYRLRKKAREVRADAVIRVRASERLPDELPPWLGWTDIALEPPRRLVGTAVVFTERPEVSHPERGPEVGGRP